MAFKRKLYNEMLRWKESRKGTSALLIKGARRVGKSTLAENFARKEYKSYILIDFSKTSKQVDALFEDMMNLDMFFFQLQNIFGVKLHERKSVIIFDEVQMQPLARQAIKHLVKDGRYDYIETGVSAFHQEKCGKHCHPERRNPLDPISDGLRRILLGYRRYGVV